MDTELDYERGLIADSTEARLALAEKLLETIWENQEAASELIDLIAERAIAAAHFGETRFRRYYPALGKFADGVITEAANQSIQARHERAGADQ